MEKKKIYHDTAIHQTVGPSSKTWWRPQLKRQIKLHKIFAVQEVSNPLVMECQMKGSDFFYSSLSDLGCPTAVF